MSRVPSGTLAPGENDKRAVPFYMGRAGVVASLNRPVSIRKSDHTVADGNYRAGREDRRYIAVIVRHRWISLVGLPRPRMRPAVGQS